MTGAVICLMSRASHATWAILGSGLLLVTFGCNPKSNVAVEPGVRKEDAGTSSGIVPGPGDVSDKEALPEHLRVDKNGELPGMTFPKKTFDIKPSGSKGFHSTKVGLVELGTKMDAAIANLEGAWGEADTVMEVGGAQLVGHSILKVKDSKTFKIEYYDPRTEGTMNRIIANGENRISFFKDTWKRLPPPGEADGAAGDPLTAWPKHFPSKMFSFYSNDAPVWSQLMKGLENGANGYSATVEERRAKVLNKDRMIYRVVAERKSDGTKLEVLVDGERHLPLTIRSVIKNSKGKEDLLMWTCAWKFGGTFESSEFVLPKATGS